MIDRTLISEQPEIVAAMCTARGTAIDLAPIRALDAQRKALQAECDGLRSQQRQASGEIAKKKNAGEDPTAIMADMSSVAETIKTLQTALSTAEAQLMQHLLVIPNLLDASTPTGQSADDNPTVRTWGEPPSFDFTPKDHGALGEALGMLDFERATKLAGARFAIYRGLGARLERALINFMLDVQTRTNGYTEVLPPLLVNAKTMTGTGQLPKFEEDLFQTTNGLYLIPTAEVPLTNIYADEILDASALPCRFAAYTPCFRSEAGSYGKDTRGLIRQHQFNKVELVSLVQPERSDAELERMTNCAEEILKQLELPYRVVQLCSGDIGFAAAKTYDLEVWLPAQDTYREISSCSNCTDFQARRANLRYRAGKKPAFVHTLNGSGLAVGRTLIAILENHQQADGSVVIPKALRTFCDDIDRITL